ncbi:zinc-binding dehydrogenase [Pedobacter frigoris]|uniref:zinc-binding dehydrogenase n=1 Tax=Pedobacter frigoris TaxID=2571272 RepID=UPI0029313042|nr:zinc-binding dehydrogenase [Pedobacter frigoris]
MKKGNIIIFDGADKPMRSDIKTVPELQEGEVLIENLYTTLCGSDLHTFCGLRNEKTPTVLGHEIVGRILKFEETHNRLDYLGNTLKEGDVVTWTIFSSDPNSEWTALGMPQKANSLFKYGHAQIKGDDAFHGGLSDYCILKKDTVILRIPEDLPLPIAATINCAIATVSGGLRLAGDLNGKNVMITGMGLLGIICGAMCKDAGAAVVWATDINEARLEQSRSFGVDKTFLLNENDTDFENSLKETFPKNGVDVVFDMSGAPLAMEFGVKSLAVGGIAIWIGGVFHSRPIQIDAEQVIRKLISIKGLHNYNYEDFVSAVDFITRNYRKYPFDDIVSKEFALLDAQEAFQYAVKHKPLRVGIRISK